MAGEILSSLQEELALSDADLAWMVSTTPERLRMIVDHHAGMTVERLEKSLLKVGRSLILGPANLSDEGRELVLRQMPRSLQEKLKGKL